jgi:uncharacterized membrane protein required for colicin V production
MLDAILAIILVGISVVGVYRGCGKILFDFLALLGALWLDSSIFVQASHSLRIVTNDFQNAADVFAVLFVLFGGIGLLLSHIAYKSILLDLGMLNKTLGLVLGFMTAVVICHAITKTISIADLASKTPSILASSRVGDETLNFTTYHSVIEDLYDATGGHRVVETYH